MEYIMIVDVTHSKLSNERSQFTLSCSQGLYERSIKSLVRHRTERWSWHRVSSTLAPNLRPAGRWSWHWGEPDADLDVGVSQTLALTLWSARRWPWCQMSPERWPRCRDQSARHWPSSCGGQPNAGSDAGCQPDAGPDARISQTLVLTWGSTRR